MESLDAEFSPHGRTPVPAEPEPRTVYVAVWNGRPIGASAHLGDVKAAAVARESRYLQVVPEYLWEPEPGDESWQLMRLNARTGRWNRTATLIHAVPIVDAPTS